MIRITQLYSNNNKIFEPIKFNDGINLILGEKVEKPKEETRKNKKTNGVGKSMSIEFINFALLKDEKDTRVLKIPLDKIPVNFIVKLDLVIDNRVITISRPWHEPDKPTVTTDGEVVPFNKVIDALSYLQTLFFANIEDVKYELPTFRELISLLIRDEDSEFKGILSCHDVSKRIPVNNLINTHLYFFDIDIAPVKEIKKIYSELDNKRATRSHLRSRLTDDGRKTMSEVKSEINSLERETEKSEIALDKFEAESLLTEHRNELASFDEEIVELRTKQVALRSEIKRIEAMPKVEVVDITDIEILYNKFQDGLGDKIGRSLKEVTEFKQKIEKYQKGLFQEKLALLKKESSDTLDRLNELDERRALLWSRIDNKGVLKDFKNSIAVFSEQKDRLSKNIAYLEEFDLTDRKMKRLELRKDNLFSEIDAQLFERDSVIKKFEKLLVLMHEFIMGNAEASFGIETVNKANNKSIIDIDLRIEDDGSHSVNRTKVFMYDIALMLDSFTRKRHPTFLVHDNIFDVDQDTLVQCLNYLDKAEKDGNEFQYILTLNRDKIESEERRNEINLDIDKHRVARFDRENTFLKFKYKEV